MIGRVISTGLRRIAPVLIRNSRTIWTHLLMGETKLVKPSSMISTSKKCFSLLEIEWNDEQFKNILDNNKIIVFMKGTPMSPQCGFSKYVCQILTMHGCMDFLTFNVLDDDVLRSRIKEFSSWPTVPQVYMNGEFIGGFDILLQLHQSGELIEELEKIGHRSILLDADEKNDS